MAKKYYNITLGGFSAQEGENPLVATKRFAEFLRSCDPHILVYEVEDEETGEKFTVDLSESDEDAVLPNND
jgi:hypothetical protein